jgi:hypothetical protein
MHTSQNYYNLVLREYEKKKISSNGILIHLLSTLPDLSIGRRIHFFWGNFLCENLSPCSGGKTIGIRLNRCVSLMGRHLLFRQTGKLFDHLMDNRRVIKVKTF